MNEIGPERLLKASLTVNKTIFSRMILSTYRTGLILFLIQTNKHNNLVVKWTNLGKDKILRIRIRIAFQACLTRKTKMHPSKAPTCS